MKFRLKAYSILEFGQRKDAQGNPHQEDAIFPAIDKLSDKDRLFILCDGMGGHDAGEVASETVCNVMARTINKIEPNPEGKFSDQDLYAAIDAAFDALDSVDTGALKKMGTTMTLLKLHEGGATIAHIGDSRVYQIRPGRDGKSTKLMFATEDHSLVNDLLKAGEITPKEAKTFPQKNVITRAMQPHQERRCRPTIKHITDIRPGDFFYLCSDGMLEQDAMDDGTELRKIFSEEGGPANEKVAQLIDATVKNRDNHSAIIVEILDVIGQPVINEDPIEPRSASAPLAAMPRQSTVHTNVPERNHSGHNSQVAKKAKRNRFGNTIIWIAVLIILIVFVIIKWVIPAFDGKSEKDNSKIENTIDGNQKRDKTKNSNQGSKSGGDDSWIYEMMDHTNQNNQKNAKEAKEAKEAKDALNAKKVEGAPLPGQANHQQPVDPQPQSPVDKIKVGATDADHGHQSPSSQPEGKAQKPDDQGATQQSKKAEPANNNLSPISGMGNKSKTETKQEQKPEKPDKPAGAGE